MPKRGENIYKRKDGRWEGRYIRGRTASGQAEYGYVYADSYKACRAKRQQCIETLPEKPAVQASAATLAQAAELFLSEKSHVLKASSWNRYFAPRCKYCQDICRTVTPENHEVSPGHCAACHFPLTGGESHE